MVPVGHTVAGSDGHGRERFHKYSMQCRVFGNHGRNQSMLEKTEEKRGAGEKSDK